MSKNQSNTYYCSDVFCHRVISTQLPSVVTDLINHLNSCWLKTTRNTKHPANEQNCTRQTAKLKAFHCTGLLSIHFSTHLFILKESERIQKGLSLVYNVEDPTSQGPFIPKPPTVNPGLRHGRDQPQENKLACWPG